MIRTLSVRASVGLTLFVCFLSLPSPIVAQERTLGPWQVTVTDTTGVVWKLNTVTGELFFCTPKKCVVVPNGPSDPTGPTVGDQKPKAG